MGAPTGTLDVVENGGRTRYQWNGVEADREKARAAFNRAVKTNYFLAVAYTAPGKAKQVRSFTEIEEIERERGTVAAQISTALVGG